MNIKNNEHVNLVIGDFISWDETAIKLSWSKTIGKTPIIELISYVVEADFPGYRSAHAELITSNEVVPYNIIEYKVEGRNGFFEGPSSSSLEIELFKNAFSLQNDEQYMADVRLLKFLTKNRNVSGPYMLAKHNNPHNARSFLQNIQKTNFDDFISFTSDFIQDKGQFFLIPSTVEKVYVFSL